ncbi:MAG: hypothetical protein QN189_06580 [Armatimonadota bacterium]|nr:hypothetical protein [Armatimonadota bacterium]
MEEVRAFFPPIGILDRLLDPIEGMRSSPLEVEPTLEALPSLEDLIHVEAYPDPEQRAEVAIALSSLYLRGGQVEKALDFLALAFRAIEEQQSPRAEIRVFLQLGEVRALQGYQREAEAYLRLALERAFGIGAEEDASWALGILGELALRRHAYETAIEYIHQGIALLDQVEPPRPLPKAYLLALRGTAYRGIGSFDDCLISYCQVLELLELAHSFEKVDHPRELQDHGVHRHGTEGALGWLQSLSAQLEMREIQRMAARVQTNLGLLLLFRGDLYASYGYLKSGLSLHRELGDRYAEGCALGGLSRCSYLLGRNEEAKEYAISALALLGEAQDQGKASVQEGAERGRLQFLLALIMESEGDRGEARRYLQEAIQAFSVLGITTDLVAAYMVLGRLHLEEGEVEEAASLLHQALQALQRLTVSLQDTKGFPHGVAELPWNTL